MKKNKNEAAKKNAEETKDAVNGKNILTENAQTDKNDAYPFKKILYGYNPDEVASFINELSKTHETSAKLHEEKLSSLKEELALSNRERDYYIEKCKKLLSETKKESAPPSDETDKTISRLTEKIKSLENENESLRNNSSSAPVDNTEMYNLKISELEEKIITLEDKNSFLKQQADKYASLSDEHKSVQIELEETKSLLTRKGKELEAKNSEINEKNASINVLTNENDELKKKNSDIEVQNSILSQRVSENEEEIARLNEINKSVVFENAEKLNALETEYTKNKLAAQKELKLYGYYVDRAELTIAELTKQMEQFRQSIEKSEI